MLSFILETFLLVLLLIVVVSAKFLHQLYFLVLQFFTIKFTEPNFQNSLCEFGFYKNVFKAFIASIDETSCGF